jgi:Holliday junction resolvase-like predicted endonuclease
LRITSVEASYILFLSKSAVRRIVRNASRSPRRSQATAAVTSLTSGFKKLRFRSCFRLGEDLVAERLRDHGFTKIENLNLRRHNYPFGDLLATKDGVNYFIGVKARNEMRQGDAGLNESYESRSHI